MIYIYIYIYKYLYTYVYIFILLLVAMIWILLRVFMCVFPIYPQKSRCSFRCFHQILMYPFVNFLSTLMMVNKIDRRFIRFLCVLFSTFFRQSWYYFRNRPYLCVWLLNLVLVPVISIFVCICFVGCREDLLKQKSTTKPFSDCLPHNFVTLDNRIISNSIYNERM